MSDTSRHPNSFSLLRQINLSNTEQEAEISEFFRLFDSCMKEIAVEMKRSDLGINDRADLLISAIASVSMFLNELHLETKPLQALYSELIARRLGRPGQFSFDQAPRANAKSFNNEIIRAVLIAMYEKDKAGRDEAYKVGRSILNLSKQQVRDLATNHRHNKIGDRHFDNLVTWAKYEICKSNFDVNHYFTIT